MREFEAFLLDLDGVVYRGERVLPGARDFIAAADARGQGVMYLSNNSFATPEEVTRKLERLGLPRPQGRVLTAGDAAVRRAAEQQPGARIFVLAMPAIEGMARAAGLHPLTVEEADAEPPAVLLVGLDRQVTYPRLATATHALLSGARFLAVNRDPQLPVEGRVEPGTGALVAALEYSTGRHAENVGKPAPGILEEAMRALGASPARTLAIGDALDLDIVAGHAAGATTALVLSGLTSAEQAAAAEGARRPEYVFPSLAELAAALAAGTLE